MHRFASTASHRRLSRQTMVCVAAPVVEISRTKAKVMVFNTAHTIADRAAWRVGPGFGFQADSGGTQVDVQPDRFGARQTPSRR